MGDLVLAVDCSTTASKAIAWDREGRAVADARAPLEEIRPTPSESEQVAEGWWDATAQALREVVDAVGADRVAGLCITHQRESYAPVDAENRSLRNAILWDDGRAGAQLAELGERFGHDELHRRTGRGPRSRRRSRSCSGSCRTSRRSPSARTASWTPTATSCSA